MASMLMAERTKAAATLSAALQARKPTDRDLAEVEGLIDAEHESMQRSETIAAETSYRESYRAGQRVAAENSAAIIGLLEEALEALVAGDGHLAADLLSRAALYRVERRDKKRKANPRSVSALYAEYQATTDEGFHAWLKANGHSDVLQQVQKIAPVRSKATPRKPPRRPARRSSNNPEDY